MKLFFSTDHVRNSIVTNEAGQVLYKVVTPFRFLWQTGWSTIWKITPNAEPVTYGEGIDPGEAEEDVEPAEEVDADDGAEEELLGDVADVADIQAGAGAGAGGQARLGARPGQLAIGRRVPSSASVPRPVSVSVSETGRGSLRSKSYAATWARSRTPSTPGGLSLEEVEVCFGGEDSDTEGGPGSSAADRGRGLHWANEVDMQDRFVRLATIEWKKIASSRLRWLGENGLGHRELETHKFLNATSVTQRTREFTAYDGRRYCWILGAYVCKLYYVNEGKKSKNLIARYHRYKSALFHGKEAQYGYLDFDEREYAKISRGEEIGGTLLEQFLVTFIYVEKLRRDREKAAHRDFRWNF
ncbi:hypothetical protein CONPUDRAFT_139683 [Coniophora puteana RWD-64-598 SS2]|uniref:DUF6593 domain-containing protein n=1 Tax=Coniophora puteana (strain RWD-64-598) TaxID=741705 RepID=A0A5M3MBS3_CONPW|nr:uncharacterized protein CONPUDRAFT_139683 [Coniophora puteana RWD-64-598 SS2]EIW76270.1 hypothetical protein CONPUDRAFT_139683 [Coniophora puteana RWD-64-598 SS2]